MKLLVFAHTPPPHHGQSYMVELLLQGLERDRSIQCYHVNSRFSDNLDDIGRLRFSKMRSLFKYCLQAIALRFRHGVRCMYYIPASPTRAALYRDWLIMAFCRPFFSTLVYHWEAAGLGEWLGQRAAWERLVSRWLLGRPELSVVLADYNRRDADFFRSKRTVIVPNGVPDPCAQVSPRQGPGARREVFNILFIGLCTREKGIFDAVEAVALANRRDSHSRFRLLVAGGFWIEREKVAFEKRVSELRFADGSPQVEYRGFVSGTAKEALFEASDCLLFPTYWNAESFGIVLVEAMARDLPVITTLWRMIPELLPKGYPFIVQPQAPTEIAEALLRLRAQGNQWNLRQHYLNHFTERHYIEKMKAALLSV